MHAKRLSLSVLSLCRLLALTTLFGLCLVVPLDARAQPIDPFLEVHDGDPLSLAALVERLGDAAVVARFASDRPLAVRVLALRAARFLHAPELAFPELAALAASRDPDLAPLAMQALLHLTRTLSRADLDAREHDGDELSVARSTLSTLAADEAARADLRRGAEAVIAMLAALEGTASE